MNTKRLLYSVMSAVMFISGILLMITAAVLYYFKSVRNLEDHEKTID